MRQALRAAFAAPVLFAVLFATAPVKADAPDAALAGDATLTVVAGKGLARPIDVRLHRGPMLAQHLAPGQSDANVVGQQRARFRVVYAGRALRASTAVLRAGRGYCLLVDRGGRGISVEVAQVGLADPGAAQGDPDRRCLAKAAR
jgi:hypothetical protein